MLLKQMSASLRGMRVWRVAGHADAASPGSRCRGHASWGSDPGPVVLPKRPLNDLKRPVCSSVLRAGLVYQLQACWRPVAYRGCPWPFGDA